MRSIILDKYKPYSITLRVSIMKNSTSIDKRSSPKPNEVTIVPTPLCDQKNSANSDATSTVESDAESLIRRFACVPIHRETKVAAMSWKYLDASPEAKAFRGKNIAIMTGSRSGLTVLDVDMLDTGSKKLDGMNEYARLLAEHNESQDLETPICLTQSGGLHIYFAYDPDVKTTTAVNGFSIDTRNDGAYIVAPPSVGKCGKYVWKDGHNIDEIEPMIMPAWLKDWICGEREDVETVNTVDTVKSVKTVKAVKTVNTIKPARKVGKKRIAKTQNTLKSYTYIYSEIEIRDLLESLPEEYRDDYSKWLAITSTLKSEGERLKDVWDEWSAKSKSYNRDQNMKIWSDLRPDVDIGLLQAIAVKLGSDVKSINRTKLSDHLETKPNVTINAKYVDLENVLDDDHKLRKCTMIKSPCGTGKTTIVRKAVHHVRKTDDHKFVSITCRKTLAHEHVRAFGKRGKEKIELDSYVDKTTDELNESPNVVIQLDSLLRLDASWYQDTILYLDEFSSLISYLLTSSTLEETRLVVISRFLRILNGAKYIICTDADTNDLCVEMMREVGNDSFLLVNTYVPDRIDAFRYQTTYVLIRKLEAILLANNGECINACFDTRREMEFVVQRLKLFCEKYGLEDQKRKFSVYSSEEGDKDDLLNVTRNWANRHVFYTPCITVGVDFSHVIMRKVFLFSCSCTVNSCTLAQMIRRCRNIEELHYHVQTRYAKCPSSIEEVRDEMVREANVRAKAVTRSSLDPKPIMNAGADADTDTDAVPENEGYHALLSEVEFIEQMVQAQVITMNFMKFEYEVADNLISRLYFKNAYIDGVYRSACKEQFEYILERAGFIIQGAPDIPRAKVAKNERDDNDEASDNDSDDEDDNTRNAEARTIVKQNKDEMVKRALYEHPKTHSEREKIIRKEIDIKASRLGINMKNKDQKIRYEKYLTIDKEYDRCLLYDMLMKDDDTNDKIVAKERSKKVKRNLSRIAFKARLIHRLESALCVKTLDIDSKRDYARFGDAVDVSAELEESLNRAFRIRKSDEDKDYKYWYDLLCRIYNTLFGGIIDSIRKKQHGNAYYAKSVNIQRFDEFKIIRKMMRKQLF